MKKNHLFLWLFLYLGLTLQAQTTSLSLATGAHTINTDNGMIDGVVSPDFDGTAFNLISIFIDPSATLTAMGSQPLVMTATGTVDIQGTINANGGDGVAGGGCNSPGGVGGSAGPGGFVGGGGGGIGLVTVDGQDGMGPGGGTGGTGDDAGGGGGGHSVAGSDAAADGSGTAGTGGSAYASLPPLTGGSGGGGGSSDDDAPAGINSGDDGGGGGGGGGGAVSISSTGGGLTVTGTINAKGGQGAIGNCSSGAGGGGSGGSIELSSCPPPNVALATLDISGGSSSTTGSDGGNGADGRTLVLSTCPTCSITASATPTHETSCNTNDGKITITASAMGCSGTLEYSLDGGPFQASNVFMNVTPGMHTATARCSTDPSCTSSTYATVDPGLGPGCPTISQTNPNDPTSFDPCSCGDPLNFYDADGDITYFHDFVEVTSMTGETWEVAAVSAMAYSDAGATNIVIGDGLTETPPGSGIYRIDLFHPPGVGFTMTVDRTAGGGPFPLMEGGTCTACKQVPTLGQWGLILLSLLILTFGVVALRKRELVMAGYGTTVSNNKFTLPFDKASFGKMLIAVMFGLAAVFAVAVSAFGYEMTAADVPGSLVAGPMLAYLIHLFVKKK